MDPVTQIFKIGEYILAPIARNEIDPTIEYEDCLVEKIMEQFAIVRLSSTDEVRVVDLATCRKQEFIMPNSSRGRTSTKKAPLTVKEVDFPSLNSSSESEVEEERPKAFPRTTFRTLKEFDLPSLNSSLSPSSTSSSSPSSASSSPHQHSGSTMARTKVGITTLKKLDLPSLNSFSSESDVEEKTHKVLTSTNFKMHIPTSEEMNLPALKSSPEVVEFNIEGSLIDMAIGNNACNLLNAFRIHGILDIAIKEEIDAYLVKIIANNESSARSARNLLEYRIHRIGVRAHRYEEFCGNENKKISEICKNARVTKFEVKRGEQNEAFFKLFGTALSTKKAELLVKLELNSEDTKAKKELDKLNNELRTTLNCMKDVENATFVTEIDVRKGLMKYVIGPCGKNINEIFKIENFADLVVIEHGESHCTLRILGYSKEAAEEAKKFLDYNVHKVIVRSDLIEFGAGLDKNIKLVKTSALALGVEEVKVFSPNATSENAYIQFNFIGRRSTTERAVNFLKALLKNKNGTLEVRQLEDGGEVLDHESSSDITSPPTSMIDIVDGSLESLD